MSTTGQASCLCGAVSLETVGSPIASVVCYCNSCRSAARAFEQVPGAPSVLAPDGGVDYCLFRKDRIRIASGAEQLEDHRLTDDSPTVRAVAKCCHAPMFLDFGPGHWLTVYRDRLSPAAPKSEFGVMAKDLPAGRSPRNDIPVYPARPARFMIKLLAAWAAMGFRRPRIR